MKTIVMPDIHHDIDKADAILKYEKPNRVIYLGDVFDDWHAGAVEAQRTAIWLKSKMERYPQDVFLFGNHDLNYIYHSVYTSCSGYTLANKKAILEVLTKKEINRFKFYHVEDSFLFTHAGLTSPLVSKSLTTKEDIFNWLENENKRAVISAKSSLPHWFYECGITRGGSEAFGGILWSDYSEFIPVPGIVQVFGHTYNLLPRINEGNFCIDCMLNYYGRIMDGVFSIQRYPQVIV